jgi:hypothetical protein
MWIRIHHGIIAKKQPIDATEVEFTPLVANDYCAQILDSGFIEITKSNDQKAFLSTEKFAQLIEAKELVVIQR